MTTIVLMWNGDLNESPAALVMARKLRTVLLHKGYDVPLPVKVPFHKTLAGAIRAGKKNPAKIKEKLLDMSRLLSSELVNGFVIDIHATPHNRGYWLEEIGRQFGAQLKSKKCRDPAILAFPAGKTLPLLKRVFNLSRVYNTNAFVLEVPALYRPAHPNLVKMGLKNRKIMASDYAKYFTSQVDRPASLAEGFLSGALVQQIANRLTKSVGPPTPKALRQNRPHPRPSGQRFGHNRRKNRPK